MASTEPPLLSLPWKTRVAYYILSRVTDAVCRPDHTINRRLMNFLDLKAPPNPVSVKGVKSSDVAVDQTRNLWFRLFTPTDANTTAPLPVVVLFHGGAFSYLSPATKAYDAVCRRFARKFPAIVLSVNYRLTPEHRFPCQYEDGFDVLKFIDEHYASVLPPNADVSLCFLAGDSAGANLAHHVAVRTCETRLNKVRIIGLISIQPFFGGEERTESENLEPKYLVTLSRTDRAWKAFLPEGENRDHWAVNVSGPNGVDISRLDGFPATVVFTAGFDPLKDWQKKYYEWLRKSGKEAELVDFPNMVHAFYLFPELQEANKLITEIKDFVAKTVAKGGKSGKGK